MFFISTVFLPPFSSAQGKAIGVGIGCILGMFPLFFCKDDDEKKKKEGQTEAKESTQPPPAPTESSKNWETNTIWNQPEHLQLGLLSTRYRLISGYFTLRGPVQPWKVFWRGF